MTCEEVIHLMHRQLDNDLTPTEEDELLKHLSFCTTCQTQFEELKLIHRSLDALPKVTPPHSIVDSILPELDKLDIDKTEEAKLINYPSATRKRHVKKRFWMPGLALVAGLFIALIVLNDQDLSTIENSSLSSGAPELAMQPSTAESADVDGELALFSHDLKRDINAKESKEPSDVDLNSILPPEAENFEESDIHGESPRHLNEDPTDQEGDLSTDPEHAPIGITEFTVEEEEKHPSPDGSYTAYLGLHQEEIFIDKEEEAYYMSKHSWKTPWLVEQITWVNQDTLYYVLHHPELAEYQYWLIHVEERKEEQLDKPYKE